MIKYTTAFLKSEVANNLNGKLAIVGKRKLVSGRFFKFC